MKKIFKEQSFCRIFNMLATIVFAMFFYYCIGFTGENSAELQDEYIYFKTDLILWNIILITISLFCLFHIGRISEKFKSIKARNILLSLVCLIAALISFWWIAATKVVPGADQYTICSYAEAFNKGDFTGLQKGEYVAIYPYQLGMITLLRGIFIIFGSCNYQAFQYLTAALVPVLVVSGCKIVRIFTNENVRAELYYLLFILFCFPMYAYTTFVYGDLISIIIGFFSTWMLLACLKRFSWVKLFLFSFSIGIAIQLRGSLLILAFAMGIILLIKLVCDRNRRSLALMIFLVLGISAIQLMMWGIYHKVRPVDARAIPASLFIVMGLNDDTQCAGWYNTYGVSVFAEVDGDLELAKERAGKDFQDYVKLYRNDPHYMVDFFTRKMNAQWNAPMYQGIAMNCNVVEEQPRLAESIFYHGKAAVLLETGMKAYQLLLYGSILFLLIVWRKDMAEIQKYVLLIGVFGGFLFSLIWEAKTRYVLPYLFMQIPYMAMGVNEFMLLLERRRERISIQ